MESYPVWPNLAAMMLGRAREWGARPMLRHRAGEASGDEPAAGADVLLALAFGCYDEIF